MSTTPGGWVRPSACGGGNCVEVNYDGDEVLVRDSKHPEQEPLRFTTAEWTAFITDLQETIPR